MAESLDGSPIAPEPIAPSPPPLGSDAPDQVVAGTEDNYQSRCPVVGVGASAGGLEALEHFFRTVPPDLGFAYIIVTHLDPTHKSLMTQLLQRYTLMPVVEIEDGASISANHVYMIPPNRTLRVEGGLLHLSEPVMPRGFRDPINTFFISLAQDYGPWATGIILSGTGSDGLEGCEEIRRSNGCVLVQDPMDAQYDGMPNAILEARIQDATASAGDLALELANRMEVIRSKHPEFVPAVPVLATPESSEDEFRLLLELVRAKTGQDLTHYKRPTILRRLERRLSATGIGTLSEYRKHLEADSDEPSLLLNEIFINVTSFFRDPAVFQALRHEIVTEMVRLNQRNQTGIRIWVAGCSTGEEAYSLAMVFLEEIERARAKIRLHVFATDIDPAALEMARAGYYGEAAVAALSPEQKERFFVKDGEGYRISRQLRNVVVFAQHDLVSDAPLSRIDLVSCRNVFIYFDTTLQRRCLEFFHYSLNHGGCLLLGATETMGENNELFRAKNQKQRIYLKDARHSNSRTPRPYTRNLRTSFGPRSASALRDNHLPLDVASLTQSALIQNYAPGTAVVNERNEVLYTVGPVTDILRLPEGVMENDIISMCPEEIRLEIRALLRAALTNPSGVGVYEGLRIPTKRGQERFKVVARVLASPAPEQKVIGISFEPTPSVTAAPVAAEAQSETPAGDSDRVVDRFPQAIVDLDQELRNTKDFLQSVVDELERSNYELKVANEELTSMNEELQSTTEELETSKEELQSINEELQSVNAELQVKVEQLADANDDMSNLLNGTEIATLFLDANLCIKRYTSAIVPIFRLLPADLGRPISHISHSIAELDLIECFGSVLKSMNTLEREIHTKSGQWYIMRVMPYRTQENTISGAVVTFSDITELKNFQEALRRSEGRNNALLESIPDTLVVTHRDGTIVDFKPGRGNIQIFPDRPFGRKIGLLLQNTRPTELVLEPEAVHDVQLGMDQVFSDGGERHVEMRVGIPHGPTLWFDVHMVPCGKDLVLCIFRNVSERKELESRLNRALQSAEQASRAKSDFLANVSHELRTPLNAIIGFAELLQSHKDKISFDESKQYVGHIQQGGRVLLNLVNAILDLAKIEAGHFELRYKSFCAQDIIRSTLNLARPIFDSKNIRLSVDLPVASIELFADEQRFVQVLLNLLSNAGKFTPNKGEVRVSAYLSDTDRFVVSVEDSGIGIAPEEQSLVFERFVQGGTSGKGAGTGLGLTLAKNFVELHGGRISLSCPGLNGKGSHFTFWIPMRSNG